VSDPLIPEANLIPAVHLRRARASRVSRSPGPPALDRRALELQLRRAVRGDVLFDPASRGLYAQDASNYWQVPLGVVLPRSIDDAIAAIAVCREHGVPIVSRAGGTALAGQTTGRGVILDWSRHLTRILEIDPARAMARVEPGVVCDDLVKAVAPMKLVWGPQPATHDRCCFGGMIANDCGGIYAQIHGTAVHNVEELDVLLYDGTRMTLGWLTEEQLGARARAGGRVGDIHARLLALRDRYAARIRERYPRIPRRVSGYNLDQLLPGDDGRINLARLLVGSEGTLATFLEMKLRLVWSHPARVMVVLGYPDIYAAADDVVLINGFRPIAVEGMDHRLHENVVQKGGRSRKYLPELPKGGAWLFVEFGAATKQEAVALADDMMRRLRRSAESMKRIDEDEHRRHLWDVREAGLGATAFVPGQRDSWPGWEDSAVPPERLGAYLRDLRRLLDEHGYGQTSLYGHFGMGCVHCRIDFELTSADGIARWRAFLDRAADLVVSHGGSLSGEHGDGQARAALLEKMFGPQIVDAFRELKAIWDPDGKMNPGKIVDPYPIDSNLRLGAAYDPVEPETHFEYPDDHGSFAHATLRCVGVGKCRRTSGEGAHDVMCPSYMVTRDERHSTRGRAHLLWEMLRGGESPIRDGWKDEGVKESLDLCLSCKGCKGDCPVNVDIATYKAEFLSHYYDGRLRPRAAYAFGLVDQWARVASKVPGLANLVTQTPGLAAVAKSLAGIAPSRTVPPFAPLTFRAWFAEHRPPAPPGKLPRVVLWPDTFNNFFHPETAIAAVEVLEAAHFEVVLPEGHVCCGRPLYDFGMLATARRYLERTLDTLRPFVEQGLPIVVLEPSCASVFRDELRSTFPERVLATNLTKKVMLLSEFLVHEAGDFELPRLQRKAIGQGHCHHKSVFGFDAEKQVLEKMGLDFTLLDSGCCGMAGSFGFEPDKHAVAQACGERVLLPQVRAAAPETIVLADGFSCREMIGQNTDRAGLHLAEVIQLARRSGSAGPVGVPERGLVRSRQERVRRSIVRARLGVATALLVAGGLAAAWRWARRRTFA
jgi:FAD/FMN-containing dehydrogenase/Fe-S oxidoreductase